MLLVFILAGTFWGFSFCFLFSFLCMATQCRLCRFLWRFFARLAMPNPRPSLHMQQALNQWRAIASPFICAGVSDCQRLKLFVPVRVLFKTAVGADYVNFQVVLVVEQTMAFVPLAQVRRLLGRAGLPLRQLHHHLYCKCTMCLFWFSLYFFLFRTSFLVTIQHDLAKEQQIFGIHLPD